MASGRDSSAFAMRKSRGPEGLYITPKGEKYFLKLLSESMDFIGSPESIDEEKYVKVLETIILKLVDDNPGCDTVFLANNVLSGGTTRPPSFFPAERFSIVVDYTVSRLVNKGYLEFGDLEIPVVDILTMYN